MKTIAITGGTGFVGSFLTQLLIEKGYLVIILTRNKKNLPTQKFHEVYWNPEKKECDIASLKNVECIIHLAGAGIADKRWTTDRKKEIVDSRVEGTKFLVDEIRNNLPKCKTFIAASAIGFYGPDTKNIPFTESQEPATDFLGKTCVAWENEIHKAEIFARTVILRFGIVLGKDKGAFPQFANPLNFGIMPILGSGKQIISWISIADLARMFVFAIEHLNIEGVYNAVAPQPISQIELMQAIASIKGGLHLPIPVPAFILNILLGEMAIEVLKSCTVSSEKIVNAGFEFLDKDITTTAKEILKEKTY